jgi:hypothetical protein
MGTSSLAGLGSRLIQAGLGPYFNLTTSLKAQSPHTVTILGSELGFQHMK